MAPYSRPPKRSLFLPLDLPDFALIHKIAIPADDLALIPTRPLAIACTRCHRIDRYSAKTPSTFATHWSNIILHLSGGLLFGQEVNPPAWLQFAPANRRHFLERDPNHDAHEADRLQREHFTNLSDNNPIWIKGKLNPIFRT